MCSLNSQSESSCLYYLQGLFFWHISLNQWYKLSVSSLVTSVYKEFKRKHNNNTCAIDADDAEHASDYNKLSCMLPLNHRDTF